jgi:uncharacterized membrane protein (UPF0182 family)
VAWQFPPSREDDDLGPPPPPFRIQRRRVEFPSFGSYNKLVFIAVGLLLTYVVLNTLKSIYVDYLWFDSIGFGSVYEKRIVTQAWLFAGGVIIFLLYFGINVFIAAQPLVKATPGRRDDDEAAVVRRLYQLALIAVTIFLAVIFGTIAAGKWDEVLTFLDGESFGMRDPQFGKDVSFYVFDLPVLKFFFGWLMGAAVLTVLAAAGLYLLRYLNDGVDKAAIGRTRTHLALLLVVIVALFIFHYWLARFDLNFSTNGAVFGATYTDIHARLPFLYVAMGMAALTIVALLAAAFGRSVLIPIGVSVVWAIVAVIGGSAYPGGVQRYQVVPNELQKELPYIQRNIDATRYAFGLNEIDERAFPADQEVTADEVAQSPETMNNIRLLDVRPLLDTYGQVQTIRPLYQFLDVDVDRYIVDGERRQVMVGARELSSSRLPPDAQSWVNQRLQFTHGYGVVMSPVNEVVQEGLPSLIERDIPVTGEFDVTRPEIYYGEQPDHYVIVNTNDKEFDYPVETGNTTTVFQGDSGVKLGSIIKRALFAWEFKDLNILISGSLNDNSRVLFRRNIQQRIRTVAPFLTLDHDPYMIVGADGHLYWMQDAYTSTDQYPYSQPQILAATGQPINYIRNSVKIVIDAYNGSMTLYLVDPSDPIAATYARIFPDLFTPFDQMPADLKAHIRYPEDLFLAQVQKYLLYHITDPVARYNQEDVWAIPSEVFEGNEEAVQPYYVIMRIPGEPQEEFALIMPLTPANRQNTIAWVAARSDGDNYGKLLAFRFPTNSLVYGPRQVETRIDQDANVAAQFGLWKQSNAKVARGNLLMIPVGNGNLFVEPIYLQSGTSQLPELKRVIVVNGNKIAMEPTLDRALAVLFGGASPTAPTTSDVTPGASPPPATGTPSPAPSAQDQTATPTVAPTATPPPTATPSAPTGTPGATATSGPLPDNVAELARQASDAYNRAQAALQAGDFAAYGQEIEQVKALLQRMVELTNGQ